jgi:hypothetical protein
VREFINHIEHPELASVVGPVLDEVVGPHVIAVLGPQPDARPVREPQASALGLPGRHFEPLASPDALHPLVVHQPARIAQKSRDLAVAVAAILAREFDQIGGEPFLAIMAPRRLALGRAMLTERAAGATLGDTHRVHDVLDTGTSTRGAGVSFPGRPLAG